MKIVFFGTPHFVIPVLQTLVEDFHVMGVVTTPPQKVGRKQVLTPSPVSIAYDSYAWNPFHEKNLFVPEKLDEKFGKQLQRLKPDLFVVAAYGQIIPKTILNLAPLGAINIHPSDLPLYRGASPIQSTLLAGDKATVVDFIKMDDKLDHGPILASFQETVKGDDTFETLGTRLFTKAAANISQVINDYKNGNLPEKPQDDTKATYTAKITKNSGYIAIDDLPTRELFDRMVRAYYPWPGVWTRWNNKIVKFYPHGVVQLEGKKPVSKKTFLEGYPEAKPWLEQLL